MMELLTRRSDLIEQAVDDELILFDGRQEHFHRLNRTAASLWRHCDGDTSEGELVDRLQHDLQQPVDPEVVYLGLERLAEAELLVGSKSWLAASMTRRRLLTKLGAAAGVGLLVPVVESIVAPAVADAQSSPR